MPLWVRMSEHDESMLLVVERARGRRDEKRRETESQIDIFRERERERSLGTRPFASRGAGPQTRREREHHVIIVRAWLLTIIILLGNNSNGLLSGCWGKVWLLQLQLLP